MSLFKHKGRRVPQLHTTALPDMIFTILFFFIMVTHLRQVTLKVQYRVPQGTQLTKLAKKSTTTYIYVGHPLKVMKGIDSPKTCIQVNDKIMDCDMVTDYMVEERKRLLPEDREQMTVVIKADRHTEMETIGQLKQALRKAGALRIHYSAEKEI